MVVTCGTPYPIRYQITLVVLGTLSDQGASLLFLQKVQLSPFACSLAEIHQQQELNHLPDDSFDSLLSGPRIFCLSRPLHISATITRHTRA